VNCAERHKYYLMHDKLSYLCCSPFKSRFAPTTSMNRYVYCSDDGSCDVFIVRIVFLQELTPNRNKIHSSGAFFAVT
jgi:hypothetical protein